MLTDRLTTQQQTFSESSWLPEGQPQQWSARREELEQSRRGLQAEVREMAALMASQAEDHEVKPLGSVALLFAFFAPIVIGQLLRVGRCSRAA